MEYLSFDDAFDIAEDVLDSRDLVGRDLDARADGVDGWYLYEPHRCGRHIVVGHDGTHLSATSTISFTKLLDAYFDGRRD